MELNWAIIGIVLVFGIILVVFLIRQNQKDEETVEKNFRDNDNIFTDEESELNNDR